MPARDKVEPRRSCPSVDIGKFGRSAGRPAAICATRPRPGYQTLPRSRLRPPSMAANHATTAPSNIDVAIENAAMIALRRDRAIAVLALAITVSTRRSASGPVRPAIPPTSCSRSCGLRPRRRCGPRTSAGCGRLQHAPGRFPQRDCGAPAATGDRVRS